MLLLSLLSLLLACYLCCAYFLCDFFSLAILVLSTVTNSHFYIAFQCSVLFISNLLLPIAVAAAAI